MKKRTPEEIAEERRKEAEFEEMVAEVEAMPDEEVEAELREAGFDMDEIKREAAEVRAAFERAAARGRGGGGGAPPEKGKPN